MNREAYFVLHALITLIKGMKMVDESKECDACGLSFYRRRRDSHDQWASRRFCSVSCRNKSSATTPLHIRFWQKVERRNDNECWIWKGSRDARGYGRLNPGVGLSPVKAHRLSWELANGPIPAGMFACHKCDTPSCVNPNHIFIGTPKDNSMDCSAKGRLNPVSRKNLRPGFPGFNGAGPISNKEIENATRS